MKKLDFIKLKNTIKMSSFSIFFSNLKMLEKIRSFFNDI